MKRLLSLFIILLLIGCDSDDGTSSGTDNEPNNILTGSWVYTYSITNQRNDTFDLNAAGGVMTGYFTNSHYGDFLTLYGDYDDTEMGFVCNNQDSDRRFLVEGTYTNNSMSGIIQVKTMAGELIQQFEFTATKQ